MKSNSKEAKPTNFNNHFQTNFLPVLLVTIAVPLSMSLWTINLISSKIIPRGQGFDEPVLISPLRWLMSCLIPIPFAVYGYKRKSLDLNGALVGLVVGFVMTLSNYCFLANLIMFFLSSSKATKYGSHLKRKIEEDFKEGI